MDRDNDQAQAFDFQMGHWRVRHRRLKTRLRSADDWEEFDGSANVRPVLGGLGNVEDQEICLPGSTYHAIAVRSFDIASGMWAIWWLDGRMPHNLDVPVMGNFERGVGTFYADESSTKPQCACDLCGSIPPCRLRVGNRLSQPMVGKPGRRTGACNFYESSLIESHKSRCFMGSRSECAFPPKHSPERLRHLFGMPYVDVVESQDLEPFIKRFFDNDEINYIYVYNAKRGCSSRRIVRA